MPTREEDSQAGYDPERTIAAKERKKMDRFIEFALVAAEEALVQAGWHPTDEAQRQRTATIIASGALAEAVAFQSWLSDELESARVTDQLVTFAVVLLAR